jgi:hypothetical protein
VIDGPLPAHLLRAHVRGRAEDGALAGEALLLLGPLHRRVELGEAEVEDLGEQPPLFILGEEDVLGLEIAVDDGGAVGLGQAAADLGGDGHRGLAVEEADLGHPLVERVAGEQLEHQEGRPVFEAAGVVDVADVGAVDGGGGAGLAEEALDDDGRGRQLVGEDLDGHALADVDVLGLVHGRHAATADLAGDPVFPREDGTYRDLGLVRLQGHQGLCSRRA